MAVSFFGLLLLILLGGGVALVVAGVAVARGGSSSGPAACGKCGYLTHGLTSLHCPECGSDLREVGIVRGKPKGSTAAAVIACVVFAALGLLLCGGLFLNRTTQVAPVAAPKATTSSTRESEAPDKGSAPVTELDNAIEDVGK